LLNYLAKIKLNKRLVAAVNLVFRAPILLAKALFVKRTILLVTNKKITTINLNSFSQFAILTFFIWAIAIFVQSLSYSHIIDTKSREISELRNVNGYFKQQFDDVNKKLSKVNEYLIFVTGGQKQNINSAVDNFEHPQNIKEQDLSKTDLHTLNDIRNANHLINNIQLRAEDRIKKIENVMITTGLGIKKFALNRQMNKTRDLVNNGRKIPEISLNQKGELLKAQGGPLIYKNGVVEDKNFQFTSVIDESDFASQIDYLEALENLVQLMPLSKPMKNYYVSSGFGPRIDPITKAKSIHPGLDLAGVSKANIMSPSAGKVIFAGKKNGYGTALIISHGYKLTTLYGHLSAIKVRVGQNVAKGQIIAQQGSTGRSTGEHLHYEVRYKNIPLNPKKFLEAGDQLLNDENNSKYVSS
jgi:murein DD-endopeptidase MepM/ murein hydrolase activator NlpD